MDGYPEPGMRVSVSRRNDMRGWCIAGIAGQSIGNRHKMQTGIVLAFVPGHGGDVWFVRHETKEHIVAAFGVDEMTPLEDEPTEGKETP